MRVLSIDVGNRCGDALLRTFIFVFGLGALALLYFYLYVRYDFLGKGSFSSPHFLSPPISGLKWVCQARLLPRRIKNEPFPSLVPVVSIYYAWKLLFYFCEDEDDELTAMRELRILEILGRCFLFTISSSELLIPRTGRPSACTHLNIHLKQWSSHWTPGFCYLRSD